MGEITCVPTKCTAMQHEKVYKSHFTLIRTLGAGGYGKVFLVRKNSGHDAHKLYAMKVVQKGTALRNRRKAQIMVRERIVLEMINRSAFLVGLNYAFQTETTLCLVLDLARGGDLFTLLSKEKCLKEDVIKICIAELVLALEVLHKLNVIHRDVKLENILLDDHGHIVLADFGCSKILSSETDYRAHNRCGTIKYTAPEMIIPGPDGYDLAVDWWSVGVVTYELSTGTFPFLISEQHNSDRDVLKRILEVNPTFPSSLSETLTDFIQNMLQKDPKRRLGSNKKCAKDIKQHSLFRGLNWTKLKNKKLKSPFLPIINTENTTQNIDEEFASQPVNDAPISSTQPRCTHHLFRGYSYVARQHLRKSSAFSSQRSEELVS
uniref:non-specific serine/threonine protein kinase n=1 Tax=Glossina brevipalpis TaxID=37001 RepID=A0A1A9W9T2_9MUSC